MSDGSDKKTPQLESAVAGLRARGIDPADIVDIVEGAKALVDIPDAELEVALRSWKDVARTVYYHDFVPILFRSLADACQETKRRQRLYEAAEELSQTRAAAAGLTIELLDADELHCPQCGAEDVDNSQRLTLQSGNSGDRVTLVCRKCGHEESVDGDTPALGFAWERHTLSPAENTPDVERSIAGLRARRIEPSGFIHWAKAIADDMPDATFEAALRAWQEQVRPQRYHDFGAILLESLADACRRTRRRQRLYEAAKANAESYASGAASGGEGVARMLLVQRIDRKLRGRGRVERKDCPTCVAIERGGVGEGRRGSLTEHTEAGSEDSPHLPPEAARLVTIGGDDRYGELKRCPECGTLYGYLHRYEYSSNSPSDDDHTLWRVADPVAALVAPLLEPLAPGLFDAELAATLRSGNREVRHAAIGILHGAAGKGPLDASVVAAAEAIAAAEASHDYEILHGCRDALSSYTQRREAAAARAAKKARFLASIRKDEEHSHVSYGVPEPEDETAAAVAAPTVPSEQAGKLLRTLEGDGHSVNAVAFSPDGKALASASYETVTLWDVATGKVIKSLVGHRGEIQALAFSPDGKILASGASDTTARLWDVASGKDLAVLSGPRAHVQSVAFSPHGKVLATGGDDNKVRLWDSAGGQEIRAFSGHSKRVNSVCFSPDGRLLASGSRDATTKLWDAAAGKEIKTLAGHGNSVNSVSFSPDGRVLASASDDETIKLWDVTTGLEIGVCSGHRFDVRSMAFSPDGRTLASGSSNSQIKLWHAPAREEIKTLAGHQSGVNSLCFSPDGRLLASGSRDCTIKLWDVKTEAGSQVQPM